MPYFRALGFACPDKVNPADFFMDCIAGKYARSDAAGAPQSFHHSDLPALWEQRAAAKASAARRDAEATAAARLLAEGVARRRALAVQQAATRVCAAAAREVARRDARAREARVAAVRVARRVSGLAAHAVRSLISPQTAEIR